MKIDIFHGNMTTKYNKYYHIAILLHYNISQLYKRRTVILCDKGYARYGHKALYNQMILCCLAFCLTDANIHIQFNSHEFYIFQYPPPHCGEYRHNNIEYINFDEPSYQTRSVGPMLG